MADWQELRDRGSEAFNMMSPDEHQEEHDRCLIFGSNIDISVPPPLPSEIMAWDI